MVAVSVDAPTLCSAIDSDSIAMSSAEDHECRRPLNPSNQRCCARQSGERDACIGSE